MGDDTGERTLSKVAGRLAKWIIGTLAALGIAAAGAPPALAADAVTRGAVTVAGTAIGYTATAGKIPLLGADGRIRARMFYVAYTVPPRPGAPPRPLTFFFNGGPGSSTVWLHMGSYGPVRVVSPQPGEERHGPSTPVPNARALLGVTDMVFLDAVSTGYSRPDDPNDAKAFLGIDEDADAFGQAIARYIAENGRAGSPTFLFGESYGTMRAAILADRLPDRGVRVNGIVLLSTILNFGHFASGLDQLTVDQLPSYAAVAWYHHRVDASGVPLESWVAQARAFAAGPYSYALEQGSRLDPAVRERTIAEMHRLTGISADTLRDNGLRVSVTTFRRELLRASHEVIGYGDARYRATVADPAAKLIDPAKLAVQQSYGAAFAAYARDTLHYVDERPYVAEDEPGIMARWDWAHQPPGAERQNALANSTIDLASGLRKNPQLRVLVLSGYFDLTTPFFGTEFDLAHLTGSDLASSRITSRYFGSGHMIYIDDEAHREIGMAVAGFITGQSTPGAG